MEKTIDNHNTAQPQHITFSKRAHHRRRKWPETKSWGTAEGKKYTTQNTNACYLNMIWQIVIASSTNIAENLQQEMKSSPWILRASDQLIYHVVAKFGIKDFRAQRAMGKAVLYFLSRKCVASSRKNRPSFHGRLWSIACLFVRLSFICYNNM